MEKFKGLAHKAKSGQYKGEWTLDYNSYPITKNGQLDCGRVKAANAYSQKNGNKKVAQKLEALDDLCDFDFHAGL